MLFLSFSLIGFSQNYTTKIGMVYGRECLVFSFSNEGEVPIHTISIRANYFHPKHGKSVRNYKFRVNLHPGQEIIGNAYVNEHRLMLSESGYILDVSSISVKFIE